MAETGTSWFSDPESLVAELQRGRQEAPPPPAIPGYRDLELLGSGGQGRVYRAVQDSMGQPVAIKVLRDGFLATREARLRFENEVELVAGLRHPGIVRVYDSGRCQDGLMYCVMEYVEGVSLAQFVGQHVSDPRRILQLFQEIAEAVQYAHQRGVIHRDLKPSNIRVDADGHPHILDFGLAKAREGDAVQLGDGSGLSMSGQFLGTIPWASPEQASGHPRDVDVRSDVYSLGLMLYQALTGRFPYPVDGGLHAILDSILHADPAPPQALAQAVDGELETVLLKCLEKDPARRYQSARELARELRHYLDGEPIEARRDSGWYVLRKNLRRHRLAVGIAAAAVLLLLPFSLTMSVLYRRSERAGSEARLAAGRAQAINVFLQEILSTADPKKAGYQVTVVDALERAAQRMEEVFASEPRVRADLHITLGRAFQNLGRYSDGTEHLLQAVALRRSVLGPDHPETLAAEYALAGAAGVPPKRSIALLRRIVAIREERLGARHPLTLEARHGLGFHLLFTGRLEEAHGILARCWEDCQAALGREDPKTLDVLESLGLAQLYLGRVHEAVATLNETVESCRRHPDPEDEQLLGAMMALYEALMAAGDAAGAAEAARYPWEVKVRVLGSTHPSTLLSASQLVHALHETGRAKEAEPIARRCFDLEISPEYRDRKLRIGMCLAVIEEQLGQSGEADAIAEPILAEARRGASARPAWTASIEREYAVLLRERGRPAEAEALLLTALDRIAGVVPPTMPQVRDLQALLGDIRAARR